MNKTLGNTNIAEAKANVPDLKVYGDGDKWTLIVQASSKVQNWQKSTKVLEVPGKGCFLQVSTQQGDHVAESTTWAAGVTLQEIQQ